MVAAISSEGSCGVSSEEDASGNTASSGTSTPTTKHLPKMPSTVGSGANSANPSPAAMRKQSSKHSNTRQRVAKVTKSEDGVGDEEPKKERETKKKSSSTGASSSSAVQITGLKAFLENVCFRILGSKGILTLIRT